MINIVSEYIKNNNLYIDKSIYITVVIGQLTIYGIMLTFYQFIASYKNSANQYLGILITEYYVTRKIWIYKIIQNKIFIALFLAELFTKPVLNIFSGYFSVITVSTISFLWYGFSICYFVIFLLLFVQCTSCTFSLKSISNIKRNNLITNEINNRFLKKSKLDYHKKLLVDMLNTALKNLKSAITFDDDQILQDNYDELFIIIINEYCAQKSKEIDLIIEKGKIVNNQIPYKYNASYEYNIFYDAVHNKYMKLDDRLQRYIAKRHLYIQYLNVIRKQLTEKGDNAFYGDRYEHNWKDISNYIYENGSIETKKYLITWLCKYTYDIKDTPSDFKDYCEEIIYYFMHKSILSVYEGENEEEFCEVFKLHIYRIGLDEMLTDILCEFVISYNEFCPNRIIDLLKPNNKSYIFMYLIIYYSIYSFRFNWKYINIELLKRLIEKIEIDSVDKEYVLSKINESNIKDKFNEKMFDALIVYLSKELTGELLTEIVKEELVNAYYIFAIKTCVFYQELAYYKETMPLKLKTEFICFLSEHNEILNNENVKKFIWRLSWKTFSKLDEVPEKMLNSFKALLLANIEIEKSFFEDDRVKYGYTNNIGKYALVKISDKNKQWLNMREIIKKVYISSNSSVEEYIKEIEVISNECGLQIPYVQKEKMKKYLLEVL